MTGKAGPKPTQPVRRVQVMLDQATIDAALALGAGNLSRGIRVAVEIAAQVADMAAMSADVS